MKTPSFWQHRRGSLSLKSPLIMGILNVTPDSFSDGGRFKTTKEAVFAAQKMVSKGADLIDIGGESTRPGAKIVSVKQELQRVIPVIRSLREESSVVISIDTNKAEVAEAAISAGADIINDISGFQFDPKMASVCAKTNAGCVLMHTTGKSSVMMDRAVKADVFEQISIYLQRSVEIALEVGVKREAILLDPGFGFGKHTRENYQILSRPLSIANFAWLAGISRKRMIRDVVGQDPRAIAHGTTAANLVALLSGYRVLRVHDVSSAAVTRSFYEQLRLFRSELPQQFE